MNKIDLYIWANDYSGNTGEGRLARNFISFLQKEYPRNIIKIKTILSIQLDDQTFNQLNGINNIYINLYKLD